MFCAIFLSTYYVHVDQPAGTGMHLNERKGPMTEALAFTERATELQQSPTCLAFEENTPLNAQHDQSQNSC